MFVIIFFLVLFQVTPQEVQSLISGFTNKDGLVSNGIRVGGEKYFFLQSDEQQAQGKKGASGVSVAKANKCNAYHMKFNKEFNILLARAIILK